MLAARLRVNCRYSRLVNVHERSVNLLSNSSETIFVQAKKKQNLKNLSLAAIALLLPPQTNKRLPAEVTHRPSRNDCMRRNIHASKPAHIDAWRTPRFQALQGRYLKAYSKMAAATATFKLSMSPGIGTATRFQFCWVFSIFMACVHVP
jgi:hypothetical protein